MGTPGRILVDGAKRIKMAGENIAVNAQIHTLGGFSAHASQTQLIEWVSHFSGTRPTLYLIHGEQDAKLSLQQALSDKGWASTIPKANQTVTL